MSEITSTTPVPSRAKDTNNEGKTEDKWGAQDTAKLLFIIMQPSNPELAVKGWKGIIEKFQQACGSKYTEHGVKKQYERLRRVYFNQFPRPENQVDDEDAIESTSKPSKKAKTSATTTASAASADAEPSEDLKHDGADADDEDDAVEAAQEVDA
ncbi:hypothetical protein UCREL1_9728 [Eutypa lata UCREL1]|uniref:Uncharacterized protein n=1 Tax=Eutypa lata (strain UCR-EL1) TaxID=1287681 RepID=M7SGL5_EUTLA|nr:hypothetical protein UCREL1_9728 [Eutypa lata UCREL1]